MTDDTDSVVCVCLAVTEGSILAAIRRGHRDLAAVRKETGANTGCGDCALDIEDLLALEAYPGQVIHR
ncbi:(2Fe-2S)-binding protein [Kitasatospora sp. NPDC048540]|uniref:(2Fe-2S)-binding protein n=1 Tax=unclassified Kitasatospora TaxID=2633591 RepID=UPI00053ACC26|nr:(2Fe-2S)-binding protein [Kitasatospora sp. MBT63]